MQKSLKQFILLGEIGDLRLGMTRDDILAKNGPPPSWLGKPPAFREPVLSPDAAEGWLYYNDAVGVIFDQANAVFKLNLIPANLREGILTFSPFPQDSNITIAQFRDFLTLIGMPFHEEVDNPDDHYILTKNNCVALTAYYDRGGLLAPNDRPVIMISMHATSASLPGFVLKWPTDFTLE